MGILSIDPVSAGANLIGGILSFGAQKSANKTNLAIARETNAANQLINQQNIDWQREALRSQQKYSSFGNQLAMARDAGVNPYLALGNQASAAGGGTPVSHAMQAAHVQPETALGSAIGRAGSDMANVMALVAQANKDTQEAKGHEIDNITKGAVNKVQLESLGKTVEAQSIQNRLNTDTYDAMVQNANLINAKLQKEQDLMDIQKDIQIFMRDKIQPQELNKIVEEIKLIQEQGLTQQSQRRLNDVMGRAHLTQAAASMVMARVEQYKAPSQVALNNAMAQNQRAQAELNQVAKDLKMIDYQVADKYAMISADADFVHKLQTNKLDRQQIWKYYNENRMLEKGVRWYEFSKFCEHPMLFSFFGQMFDTDTAK